MNHGRHCQQGDDRLHGVGCLHAAADETHAGEDALNFLEPGRASLDHEFSREGKVPRERDPTFETEGCNRRHGHERQRHGGGRNRAPVPAGDQRRRMTSPNCGL